MHPTHIRTDIQRALNNFTDGELYENATHLLNVLGYESQRTLSRDTNTTEAFLEDFDRHRRMNRDKALLHEWNTADFLFQLTADEITQHTQETIVFHEDEGVDDTIYYSYLFLAIKTPLLQLGDVDTAQGNLCQKRFDILTFLCYNICII